MTQKVSPKRVSTFPVDTTFGRYLLSLFPLLDSLSYPIMFITIKSFLLGKVFNPCIGKSNAASMYPVRAVFATVGPVTTKPRTVNFCIKYRLVLDPTFATKPVPLLPFFPCVRFVRTKFGWGSPCKIKYVWLFVNFHLGDHIGGRWSGYLRLSVKHWARSRHVR